MLFRKIGTRSGIQFPKIGLRNGYVLDALMAGLRPKVGQVHPLGLVSSALLFFKVYIEI